MVAGLKHAASGQHQDYPEGILELGVALDGLDMLVTDVFNALPTDSLLVYLALECLKVSQIADAKLPLTPGPCRDIM